MLLGAVSVLALHAPAVTRLLFLIVQPGIFSRAQCLASTGILDIFEVPSDGLLSELDSDAIEATGVAVVTVLATIAIVSTILCALADVCGLKFAIATKLVAFLVCAVRHR